MYLEIQAIGILLYRKPSRRNAFLDSEYQFGFLELKDVETMKSA